MKTKNQIPALIIATQFFLIPVPTENVDVQCVVNIFEDKRATVKLFLPEYPSEQNLCWILQKAREPKVQVDKQIHEFVDKYGAKITHYGY